MSDEIQIPNDALVIPESVFSTLSVEIKAEAKKAKALLELKDDPTPEQSELAYKARRSFAKLRCVVEERRVGLVEGSVKYQRNVNTQARELKDFCSDYEGKFLAIEEFQERKAAKARAELKAKREAELRPYCENTSLYDLASMSEEAWVQLLDGQKAMLEKRNAEAAKAEEERKAREEADRLERERMRAENERLRKESEAAEAKERARKAQEAAKLKAEREAREKAESEARALREAQAKREKEEADRIAAEKAAARKAARAPDKEKIKEWLLVVEMAAFPDVKTDDGFEAIKKIAELRAEFILKSNRAISSL